MNGVYQNYLNTMSNPQRLKERIYEKFRSIGEGSVRFVATRNEVFDFFWNEIQQIRSSDKERLMEEISNLTFVNNDKRHKVTDETARRIYGGVYNHAITNVLSIIKQSNV